MTAIAGNVLRYVENKVEHPRVDLLDLVRNVERLVEEQPVHDAQWGSRAKKP